MADRSLLEFNGNYFETIIAGLLAEKYPEAKILHDVSLFCTYLGKTTQIDVIMLHPRGLFVIEAKNWYGWIKGNLNDVKWKGKSLSKDIMTVYSPFNQNFLHIRTLRNHLRVLSGSAPEFKNYVCLPDGTDINSDCKCVCNLSLMLHKIESDIRYSTQTYDVNSVQNMIENIKVSV